MSFTASTARRVAALVIVAALCASCGLLGRKGGAGGFQMPPMPVEVAEVHPQIVRDEFHALGGIESDDIIQVVSELDATVVSLPFTEGEAVGQGALLVQLDDREIRAEAERAAANHAQAQSNFARAQKLAEQSAISAQELDAQGTALKVAEAEDQLAKARLDKTRIRAAFAGMVGRRRVSKGAYLKAGDLITELARVDQMKVSFATPERFVSQIRPGVAVQVATPAFPGETFTGRVSVVDPIVDPQTRTVQIVARIANPGRRLRPGMSANISVTFAERAKALVVPDEAIFAEGNQSYVYKVKPDSSVTRVAVALGTRDSMHVEILSGLERGDRVVQAGHQKLFEGAHVIPVMADAVSIGGPGAGTGGAGTDPAPAATAKGSKGAKEAPKASSGKSTSKTPGGR